MAAEMPPERRRRGLVDRAGLGLVEARLAPGEVEPRHRHRIAREVVYVLHGELVVEIDGFLTFLASGGSVEIPAGAPHSLRNLSRAPADVLLVSHPSAEGDFEPLRPAGSSRRTVLGPT